MYLAPACALWQATGVLIFERPDMVRNNALGLMAAKPALYLTAAALGFGVNTLSYIVIQTTSSLTLKVLGTVKNTLIVGIGVALLGDIITGVQVCPLMPLVQEANSWTAVTLTIYYERTCRALVTWSAWQPLRGTTT